MRLITRKRLLVVAVAGAALALWLFWNPHAEVFLLPDGYRGPVLVAFNHPKGRPLERTIDAYVFRIPGDGILRIKDSEPDGFKYHYWYYLGAQDRRTLIPFSSPEDLRHITTPRVRQDVILGCGVPLSCVAASVGIPADEGSFGPSPQGAATAVRAELPPLPSRRYSEYNSSRPE